MKRICWLFVLLVVLTGCSQESGELANAAKLRDKLLSGSGCSFQVKVTADYGDALQDFSMDCRGDNTGKLFFEITQPQSIAGIQGNISDQGGNITFENQALYFPLLTDDLLTPASAPWILLKTLRSGYLASACTEGELIHLTVDDSYAEDALTLDIWLKDGQVPIRADILQDGKRILALEVENFVIS